MALPLSPTVEPQLALSRKALPAGEGWHYEPKLDGFRCLAFVDGEELFLQSRNGRPLQRYFPELRFPSGRLVLDGEIVLRGEDGHENFDGLQQRIHPARSRIERLAAETPTVFVAFDLLALGDDSWLERPFAERRSGLLALDVAGHPVELMTATDELAGAEHWLRDAEGVIAKERDAPYRPGERRGMVKVKRVRTIDAVVVGWRPGKEPDTVGALIIGLYDGDELRVVGHTSSFTAAEKRRLVGFLAPYETGNRGSGAASRWTSGRDLEWVSLRPELVIEVDFDHVSAGRIRHGARLRRWREDREPRSCLVDQLAQ
ncbi:MAG TPA: ATP-dependent DNA ligase [Solirubrobacteraceae bacterium]|jgi:ATP-dependent DNA ligase|nr:ATP-dependent DNA ligase [Solirubrobacteraceae bacterium]